MESFPQNETFVKKKINTKEVKNENCNAGYAAIAALREKIAFLENENVQLKNEYETIKETYEEQYILNNEKRETALKTATLAQEIVQKTKASYEKIAIKRAENFKLKSQLDDLEKMIEKQKQKNNLLLISKRENYAKQTSFHQTLQQIEQLIGELLIPPAVSSILNSEEIALINAKLSSSLENYSNDVIESIQHMQELPKVFVIQPLNIQQEIIETLIKAQAIAHRISLQIRYNEKLTLPSSRNQTLHFLSEELTLLSIVMKQFCFGKTIQKCG